MIPDVDMSSYDKQGCLHQIFTRQAKETPDKVAVVDISGVQMTFRELDEITDRLAFYLGGIGVGRNKVVGILMERCLEYTISYISILKAGGAYLPVEMSYPESLVASVIADAEPIAICSKKAYLNRIKTDVPILDIDLSWLNNLPLFFNETEAEVAQDHSILFDEVTLDDLAFTVYSSGTTGKPKGIQCPHRGAVFSYTWRHYAFPYEENEKEACNIFFVWEMFRPLMKGVTMNIVPDTIIYDPPQLLKFLKRNKITRMLFTPSLLQTILDTQKPEVIADHFVSFRQIWLCGEVVTTNLRNRVAAVLPWIRILNLYSISECHDVSCSDLTNGQGLEGRTYCPVGQIFPQVRVIVMDENFNEKVIGEAGEIYIGGPTLAIGYLKRPELTNDRFIHCPSVFDGRLYRTGDWGYKLSDNSLEIIGRCDSMVKIRGYTVELKAIENALLNIPGVNMACAVVVGPEGSDKILVAYIVPNDESSKNVSYLRTQLKVQLPFFMIPSQFIFLDKIPIMETTGKTNKGELPAARCFSLADVVINDERLVGDAYKIATLWCEVLKLCTIDADDNFFDLGGHSLMAAIVVGKLNDMLGTSLSTLDLYANPTIEALSNKIKTGENSKAHDVDLMKELKKFMIDDILNIKLRSFWKSVKYSKTRFHSGCVLLTGAVGFLGSFVLQNLLKNTQVIVYCLVRSSVYQSAEQRLKDTLKVRGLSTDLLHSRVVLINGDITLKKFGLEEVDYLALCTDIDLVIHCAAYVNIALPYSALSQVNVLGTHHVLLFCLENKLKPLHYISTSDVFPTGMQNCSENTNMLTLLAKLSHGYAQTKWIAEQIVESASRKGLPTIISRCGNIGGCRLSGIWNTNDMNLLIMQGALETGKAPDIDWQIEFTSVDFIGDIVVKLTLDWERSFGKVYHLINSSTIDCRNVWALLRELGYRVDDVSFDEWSKAVDSVPGKSKVLLSLKQLLDSRLKTADYLINYSTFSRDNVEAFLKQHDLLYPHLSDLSMRNYLTQLIDSNYIPSLNLRIRPSLKTVTGESFHQFKNKVALVTGASSGMGYAISGTLARAGVITVGVARTIEKMHVLQKELSNENIQNFIPMKVDITSRAEVFNCVNIIQSTIGPIDFMINNAGVMEYLKMENAELDHWLNMVNVNCIGFLHTTAAVLPQMKDRKCGHIVNITSDAGRKPFLNLAVYSGTKFFVESISEALRQEIAAYSIKVTCIQPGDVSTGLHEKSFDIKTKEETAYNIEYLNVDDICNAVKYVLGQPKNCAVNTILIEPLHGPI